MIDINLNYYFYFLRYNTLSTNIKIDYYYNYLFLKRLISLIIKSLTLNYKILISFFYIFINLIIIDF